MLKNMPLFNKRSSKRDEIHHEVSPPPAEPLPPITRPTNSNKPALIFHCQQAQGSPTGLIQGFTTVRELYQKIAECYDFPTDEILFCTLNTHKVDMTRLLGGQIGLDDFIFVHRKGSSKEVNLTKTQDALGLTITDNGAGYAFVKRIRDNSVLSGVQVGDHIEKVGAVCVVGKRHFEVARLLKEIPKDSNFTLSLVEPLRAGFANIGPRGTTRSGSLSCGTGKETLRLRGDGSRIEQQPTPVTQQAVDKINSLLDSYMGINDTELATQIWEMADGKKNSMDFAEAIDGSDLEAFRFSDDFIIELWGVITDARSGRLAA